MAGRDASTLRTTNTRPRSPSTSLLHITPHITPPHHSSTSLLHITPPHHCIAISNDAGGSSRCTDSRRRTTGRLRSWHSSASAVSTTRPLRRFRSRRGSSIFPRAREIALTRSSPSRALFLSVEAERGPTAPTTVPQGRAMRPGDPVASARSEALTAIANATRQKKHLLSSGISHLFVAFVATEYIYCGCFLICRIASH